MTHVMLTCSPTPHAVSPIPCSLWLPCQDHHVPSHGLKHAPPPGNTCSAMSSCTPRMHSSRSPSTAPSTARIHVDPKCPNTQAAIPLEPCLGYYPLCAACAHAALAGICPQSIPGPRCLSGAQCQGRGQGAGGWGQGARPSWRVGDPRHEGEAADGSHKW